MKFNAFKNFYLYGTTWLAWLYHYLLHVVLIFLLYHIVTAPTITQGPMNQSIPRGSSVNFTCSATGYPEADFTWYYGNTVLGDDGVITVTEDGSLLLQMSTLTVDGVTLDDEGTYTCNVNIRARTAVASATLNVEG